LEYAIKFFANPAAFLDEARLYTDRGNPLGKFLPDVHSSCCGMQVPSSWTGTSARNPQKHVPACSVGVAVHHMHTAP
jgi:hypothetical protein